MLAGKNLFLVIVSKQTTTRCPTGCESSEHIKMNNLSGVDEKLCIKVLYLI